jgi:hypothetical protein
MKCTVKLAFCHNVFRVQLVSDTLCTLPGIWQMCVHSQASDKSVSIARHLTYECPLSLASRHNVLALYLSSKTMCVRIWHCVYSKPGIWHNVYSKPGIQHNIYTVSLAIRHYVCTVHSKPPIHLTLWDYSKLGVQTQCVYIQVSWHLALFLHDESDIYQNVWTVNLASDAMCTICLASCKLV